MTLRGPTFLRGRILRRSARRPGLDLSIIYSCGTAPELNRTSLDTTPLTFLGFFTFLIGKRVKINTS